MEPAPGKLNYIKGQMPHSKGMIIFDLKRSGPTGLTGEVILPEGLSGNFIWNGKTIVLRGTTIINL